MYLFYRYSTPSGYLRVLHQDQSVVFLHQDIEFPLNDQENGVRYYHLETQPPLDHWGTWFR